MYAYAAGGAFPSSPGNGTNYWVDVAFSPASPPVVSSQSPAPRATGVPVNSVVSAAFNTPVAPASVVLSAQPGRVQGAVTYNVSTQTATFTPAPPFAAGTSYSVSVSADDPFGTPFSAPPGWSLST